MKTFNTKKISYYSMLIALCFIRAISAYSFIIPNQFAPGGVSGIASIVYNAVLPYNQKLAETWLNPAVLIFVLNLPLLILAFKKINKVFSFNTMLCVIFYSGFLALFSIIKFPAFKATDYESSYMILAALAGGITSGISLGFMLMTNMSAGGTDIIAKLIYAKNPVMNVQWIIFMADAVVVLLSGVLGLIGIQKGEDSSVVFARILSPIFYSFITMFASSKTAEIISNGFESSVVFNITTVKYEEISKEIVNTLNRGATIIKGEGVYTHTERKIVVCVVRKKQLVTLRKLILSIDPQAFMYITNAREVNGLGFKRG